jgi:peptidyl-prolyl cis-trans isomerase B (cyclophilin B)
VPSEKRARQRAAREQKMAEIQRVKRRQRTLRRGIIIVVLLGAVVGIVYALASGNNTPAASKTTTTKPATVTTPTTAPTTSTATTATIPSAQPTTGGTLKSWVCPNLNGTSPHDLQFPSTQPPMCIDPSKTYTATVVTNEGDITFTLDTAHTPETADNFIVLALYHYYDGTSIFRIDPSIDILQGGSPHTQSADDPGPGYTIKDEGSGYKYAAGDIVMARTSAPNSASAQYFFVYGSAASVLDSQGTYVTFGHLTGDSLAVLQKIAGLYEACPTTQTSCQGLGGGPKTLVLISKVTISES